LVFSQTEAEKTAWSIAKDAGLQLVTINPTFVLGPTIGSRADATSILDFKARLNVNCRHMPGCKVKSHQKCHGAEYCSFVLMLLRLMCLQGFIENTNDSILPWQVDVRDVACAHVLAAEVMPYSTVTQQCEAQED
jgi:nucleoside-diphosphate-sugar epimerase